MAGTSPGRWDRVGHLGGGSPKEGTPAVTRGSAASRQRRIPGPVSRRPQAGESSWCGFFLRAARARFRAQLRAFPGTVIWRSPQLILVVAL